VPLAGTGRYNNAAARAVAESDAHILLANTVVFAAGETVASARLGLDFRDGL
jgi:hypothetical protein